MLENKNKRPALDHLRGLIAAAGLNKKTFDAVSAVTCWICVYGLADTAGYDAMLAEELGPLDRQEMDKATHVLIDWLMWLKQHRSMH